MACITHVDNGWPLRKTCLQIPIRTAFSTEPFPPPASAHPVPPNRPPAGALALGERVSPRAPGSPPPPHRSVRRAAGQPCRPPARITGHGQDGWLVTGSLRCWGCSEGWKGRGLWVTSGNRAPAHIEGIDAPSPGAPGKTLSSPLVVHFQLRLDPLAH